MMGKESNSDFPLRSIPIRCGLRYTFPVMRYYDVRIPGWDVFRYRGGFIRLPPGCRTHYGEKNISRFLRNADRTQLRSFESVSRVQPTNSKTSNCTESGIYWTGRSGFRVTNTKPVKLSFINGVHNDTHWTGLLVENDTYRMIYMLDKDVSLTDLYKYMLFYSNKIAVTETGCNLPYRGDRRLNGCSIENFNVTPLL